MLRDIVAVDIHIVSISVEIVVELQRFTGLSSKMAYVNAINEAVK